MFTASAGSSTYVTMRTLQRPIEIQPFELSHESLFCLFERQVDDFIINTFRRRAAETQREIFGHHGPVKLPGAIRRLSI